MSEVVTKRTQAALRKDVYDFLRASGFDLSVPVQRKLSDLLKSVYDKRVTESHQTPQGGVLEHKVVCPKCGDYKLLPSKNAWKGFKRRVPAEHRTNQS